MRPVCQALRLAVGDRQRLTVMSAPDAIGGAEAAVRNHSDLRGVDKVPMSAEAARRLTEALTAATDRAQEQHSSCHISQMS